MYVCGPTVYDSPHIGNGRSIVIYDLLYRLLIQQYSQNNVLFVRNITDVDDKINLAAKQQGVSIRDLTTRVTKEFHSNVLALNCLLPSIEPRVTDHIPDIISMVSKLIESQHAYVANGHVYFRVASFKDYGKIAGRDYLKGLPDSERNLTNGKQEIADFVLWKPFDIDDDESSIFDSPWGRGRPGWHIECSAMSTKYLGTTFDIHGGGLDLIFPHHTNEIAQSCSCYEGSEYARYWVHNGFLEVNGEKMSKSLGNFITLSNLLASHVPGEVVRFTYLMFHYRKPMDWTENALSNAKKSLDSFYRLLGEHQLEEDELSRQDMANILADDLNTPEAIAFMHFLVKDYNKTRSEESKNEIASRLYNAGRLLGLFFNNSKSWFQTGATMPTQEIKKLVDLRTKAKANQNWAEADNIRNQLKEAGIILEDNPDGTTTWRSTKP